MCLFFSDVCPDETSNLSVLLVSVCWVFIHSYWLHSNTGWMLRAAVYSFGFMDFWVVVKKKDGSDDQHCPILQKGFSLILSTYSMCQSHTSVLQMRNTLTWWNSHCITQQVMSEIICSVFLPWWVHITEAVAVRDTAAGSWGRVVMFVFMSVFDGVYISFSVC